MSLEIDRKKLIHLINELRGVQKYFCDNFKVDDILSNSKIFEILIANNLKHNLIPGHSGSKDAEDKDGIYEYKHFKELSSNHSWTFNDYSETTIKSLLEIEAVIFAHINDTVFPYIFDWYFKVPGTLIANYLNEMTKKIKNTRKMINVSPSQIEKLMGINISYINKGDYNNGKYYHFLEKIFNSISEIEKISNTINLLTSNKFWELLVAIKLAHNVNPEQGGRKGAHDAFNGNGNYYEYKVSKTHSWQFQDISDNVLKKYLQDNKIILAVVNKSDIMIKNIYSIEPRETVKLLKEKLEAKKNRYQKIGKEIRRLQTTLSKTDLKKLNTIKII